MSGGNRHRSELTWPEWKENCARVDCQPFMAWKNGTTVHMARFNPAYNENFINWLRQQEDTAKAKGANFVCYILSSGRQESKKLK